MTIKYNEISNPFIQQLQDDLKTRKINNAYAMKEFVSSFAKGSKHNFLK